jgi:hypothetical protein
MTGEEHTGFWWADVTERDHLKYLGVDGNIILKCIFKKWDEGLDWIVLAQGRYMGRDLVGAVINLRVS